MNDWREDKRFGSARPATFDEIAAVGLLKGNGLPGGFANNRLIQIPGDAPAITFSGAGGGKMATAAAYQLCRNATGTMVHLDPRGEGLAISEHVLAATGTFSWTWNPYRILPSLLGYHRVNPLEPLTLDSPTFHVDVGFIMASIFPVREDAGNGRYFQQTAQSWASAITKSIVERTGYVSFPSLYRVVNAVQSDQERWKEHLTFMLNSRFADVRRTAGEMLAKQTAESNNEFGGVMGEIYGRLSVLDDPVLLDSLEQPDFSLSVVADKLRTHRITLNVPASYIDRLAPIIRCIFTTVMLYKERAPDAPRVVLLIDEAGQLKHFPDLLKAFTYGRGFGLRTWALFQDVGQIVTHYGEAGLQSFLASAQMRQFFSIRDFKTAKLVSDMLGMATIAYDDDLKQDEARKRKHDAFMRILNGEDPWVVGREYAQHDRASRNRTKMGRLLLSPDEVLTMPSDGSIVFASGLNLHPIFASKFNYWTRSEMAGRYLNNPYHADPFGPVSIMTRWGQRWADTVVETSIPRQLEHLPQYQPPQSGFRYVRGFRPI